ncbi:MAG TPA: DUF2520 domain-containing protein [Candidatus Dormibacteraeota bacterium]|nr:DUF2520 domain-containing protein [Candidatus Dormibacteraeota bacterium]
MAEQPEVARTSASTSPLRVGFVGSGRAAGALARSLARRRHTVLVAARGASATALAQRLGSAPLDPATVLRRADVTLVAVPDGRIAKVATELAANVPYGRGRVVAHLAGSLGPEALAPLAARGYTTAALHPLQVMSGWRIPPGTRFAVEAAEEAHPVLRRLINDLGGEELALPSGSRAAYHAAAVITANLGMTLLAEAVDLMERAGLDREEALQGLAGLSRGGLEASLDRGLPAALTGPVTRGDVDTVRVHLDLLRDDPAMLDAYRAVSRLALRQARLDGRPDPDKAQAMESLLEDKP